RLRRGRKPRFLPATVPTGAGRLLPPAAAPSPSSGRTSRRPPTLGDELRAHVSVDMSPASSRYGRRQACDLERIPRLLGSARLHPLERVLRPDDGAQITGYHGPLPPPVVGAHDPDGLA